MLFVFLIPQIKNILLSLLLKLDFKIPGMPGKHNSIIKIYVHQPVQGVLPFVVVEVLLLSTLKKK